MANNIINGAAEIIQAFLKNPLDRKAFDRFFHLCYCETMSYLRLLRSFGWKLPHDQVQQETAISDIAFDILGPFLASRKDRPYYVVFEYFERHKMGYPNQIDPESLCRCFRVLLRGFIRKELTFVRGLENPQIRNLKRRIKDILAGPDYGSKVWPNERDECYFAAENANRLRYDCPPIAGNRLCAIVKEAFIRSCTRTEWCTEIFGLLEEEIEFRNALGLHELISVMVTVNSDFVDTADLGMGRVPAPTEDYLHKQMSVVIEQTVAWLESEILNRFIEKGRLSEDDVPLMLEACRNYLRDFGIGGNTEEIPKYFMALKSGLSQTDYLKRYKYAMETVINRGLDEFRTRLRKDVTLWPFGSYL